jgi:hypothetical protein
MEKPARRAGDGQGSNRVFEVLRSEINPYNVGWRKPVRCEIIEQCAGQSPDREPPRSKKR